MSAKKPSGRRINPGVMRHRRAIALMESRALRLFARQGRWPRFVALIDWGAQ